MRSISWKPAATARHTPHSMQNFFLTSVPCFLTETDSFNLQRHRLRSRIVELGSIDVAECRVEDVRMVDSAAINVCRCVPHIFPRMDRGFPVRFNIVFSPRSLINEAQPDLRRQSSSAYAQPTFRRSLLPTWQIPNFRLERLAGNYRS